MDRQAAAKWSRSLSDANGAPQETGLPPEHRASIKAINAAILAEEQRVRARHAWLAHQDALCLAISVASVAGAVGLATAYLRGLVPWFVAVPLIAIAISFLHEIEHDLIHGLYFGRNSRAQNALFLVIWMMKQNLNPWTRRALHLLHHRRSGQREDLEERLIGLGEPLGLWRVLSWFPFGSAILLQRIQLQRRRAPRSGRRGPPRRLKLGRFAPVALALDGVFFLSPFLLLGAWLKGAEWAGALLVVMVLPNLLRHAAIAFVSSYSHYYGIREHDVYEQNQVLNHPIFWPLQVLCFNFGATHVIHHYVVQQPFYLRQLVARAAHAELKRQGVPFNDFSVFRSANRRPEQPALEAPLALQA